MHKYVTGSAERSQRCCRISQEEKKSPHEAGNIILEAM